MSAASLSAPRPPSILIVDNDPDIINVITMTLAEENFEVHTLSDVHEAALLRAVDEIEPDCVLLDSSSHDGYGSSWDLAAMLARRPRPVPVIMFTAHRKDTDEANENTSTRSKAARFAGVLAKPFAIDNLFDVVATAIDRDD